MADIDEALEEIELDRIELLDLRNMAVRRHGGAPKKPDAKTSFGHDSGEAQRIETVADLASRYQTDPDLPFHKVRHRSRTNYISFIKRIVADRGHVKLADLNAGEIKRLHDEWTKDGRLAMARGLLVNV